MYSGTLKCDHLDNLQLTTLPKRPPFSRPVLVLLCLNYLDKVTTSLIWPCFSFSESGPIIKVPLYGTFCLHWSTSNRTLVCTGNATLVSAVSWYGCSMNDVIIMILQREKLFLFAPCSGPLVRTTFYCRLGAPWANEHTESRILLTEIRPLIYQECFT